MIERRFPRPRLVGLVLSVLAATAVVGTAGLAQRRDTDVRAIHVQGNVWMLVGGAANAAVSIGEDGVLVVDTMAAPQADGLLAEIRRLAGDKPIRSIVNTHAHPDHTGGNETIAAAGESIIGGNFVAQVGQDAANRAAIFAHEQTLNRMSAPQGGRPAPPVGARPTDTFFDDRKDLYFNGEAIELLHQPAAHTDGDILAWFRKSDVVVAGDLYLTTTYPIIDLSHGGQVNGVIAALNRIIAIAVPKARQEGGTYVIPGHGRLSDEADVVEYRDMLTIVRDRIQDAIARGRTLDQVKAAGLTHDYDGRYGASEGAWTTAMFVEAVYRSLAPEQAVGGRR